MVLETRRRQRTRGMAWQLYLMERGFGRSAGPWKQTQAPEGQKRPSSPTSLILIFLGVDQLLCILFSSPCVFIHLLCLVVLGSAPVSC